MCTRVLSPTAGRPSINTGANLPNPASSLKTVAQSGSGLPLPVRLSIIHTIHRSSVLCASATHAVRQRAASHRALWIICEQAVFIMSIWLETHAKTGCTPPEAGMCGLSGCAHILPARSLLQEVRHCGVLLVKVHVASSDYAAAS